MILMMQLEYKKLRVRDLYFQKISTTILNERVSMIALGGMVYPQAQIPEIHNFRKAQQNLSYQLSEIDILGQKSIIKTRCRILLISLWRR